MIKLIYNFYLFFKFKLLEIVGIQTNDTLILTNNNFASTEKEIIKSTKIITKDKKYLTPVHPPKFNDAQIKLDSNNIILAKKSHIEGIFLITNHIAGFTSSREITKKKLLSKK